MFRSFSLLAGLAGALAAQAAPQPSPESPQAFVNKYCAGCHNDKLKSGGFSWTKVDLAHPDQTAAEAEKAINMLKVGMMPPPGLPRPDPATLRSFADSIAARIDQAALARLNPGAPPLHRLNRTEYHNAVRDMLGLDVDVAALLPADDMSRGFDNMADVLTISPALMEGYIR